MRKMLCALMIPLLFLTACGRKGGDEAEQLALDIRGEYLSMVGCTATLAVTADYGERVFDCTMTLNHTAGGETSLTILEPELLRGVTARLQSGESLLEFDGVSVETGPLSPDGLSPMDCVPYVLREIKEGFISQWGMETLDERDCVRFTTSDPNQKAGEGTETGRWFDAETHALRRAELTVEGLTALRCDVTEFQWKT